MNQRLNLKRNAINIFNVKKAQIENVKFGLTDV